METIKVMVPDYYSKFHCIGSECLYLCCNNWGEISIDKDTYKKYKDFPSPDFNKKVQWAFKPLKKPDGSIEPHRAAVVVFNERRECPFLMENKLCEIHQKMGIGYLSETCKQYPRSYIKNINSNLEASLSLSCMEVARLALFHNGKQKFEKIDMNKKYVDNNKSSDRFERVLKEYIMDIRQNCIEMMQNDELPILQRIFCIAHFLQGMENALNKKEDSGNKIDLSINSEQVTNAISEKSGAFREFMAIISDIIVNAFGKEAVKKTSNIDIHRYIIANSRTEWENLLNSKSIVFENYFVNFIFQKVFPFSYEKLSMFQHAFLLWERYELCRFFLGTFIVKFGKIEDKDIIHVVSKVEKHFTHEPMKTTIDRILKVYSG